MRKLRNKKPAGEMPHVDPQWLADRQADAEASDQTWMMDSAVVRRQWDARTT